MLSFWQLWFMHVIHTEHCYFMGTGNYKLNPSQNPQKSAPHVYWAIHSILSYRYIEFKINKAPVKLQVHLIIPPATKLGGVYWNHPVCLSVRPSVRPSVCRRARSGKIARLGIGCRGGYFVPLGQPHSSYKLPCNLSMGPSLTTSDESSFVFKSIYTPRKEVRGGILESPCPSVRPSVVRIWVSGA